MIPDLALIARLRDVHPPPEPAWWPPAPGWWLLAALAAMLVALAVRLVPPWWRRWRRRRQLLAALAAIAARHRAGAPAQTVAAEVSMLLRLAAVALFPERAAAGLYGGEWITFLEACDGARGRFAALHSALGVAPYMPPGAQVDAPALIHAARNWLRAVA